MGIKRAAIVVGELATDRWVGPGDEVSTEWAWTYTLTGQDGKEYQRTEHVYTPFTPEVLDALRLARDALRLALGDTFRPFVFTREEDARDRMRAAVELLEDAVGRPA